MPSERSTSDTERTTFADVLAACGSSSHDGGLTPPELEDELAEVHPVVLATLVRRWAQARENAGRSGAEHPHFRNPVEGVLDSSPHGYGDCNSRQDGTETDPDGDPEGQDG